MGLPFLVAVLLWLVTLVASDARRTEGGERGGGGGGVSRIDVLRPDRSGEWGMDAKSQNQKPKAESQSQKSMCWGVLA